VIDAYNSIGDIKVPIIVRLQGTNAEEAQKLIKESGLKVQSAILLSEAAALVNKPLPSPPRADCAKRHHKTRSPESSSFRASLI